MLTDVSTSAAATFEVRFQSLFHEGRSLAFPCDREGHLDLDHASDRARNAYLFARAMVGREYACPQVVYRQALAGAGSSYRSA